MHTFLYQLICLQHNDDEYEILISHVIGKLHSIAPSIFLNSHSISFSVLRLFELSSLLEWYRFWWLYG